MPGNLGIISAKNESSLFHSMQKKMNHLHYSIDEYINNGVHIASIRRNSTLKSDTSKILVTDKYILAFYGEIFSCDTEFKPEDYPDEEFFMSLIYKSGLEILNKINGHFSACLFDTISNTTYLISDRFGTLPVYYAESHGRLIFASELKSVVSGLSKTEINYHSISELFAFGHLFGTKTMFNEIHLLPAGSYLKFSTNNTTLVKYWDYPYNEEIYMRKKISTKEETKLQEELFHLMMNAAKKMANNPDDILFSLSGGLDSRYVVALYNKLGIKDMTAFTMGSEISEDQIYAKQVAEKLGINHYSFTINPFETWENAKHFAYLSDNMAMINGPLQNYEPLKYFYDKKRIVIYSQMCDAIFGSTLWRKRIKILKNTNQLNDQTERILIDIFKIFDQNLIRKIFMPEFYNKIHDKYLLEPSGYLKKEFHPLHIYYLLLLNEHGRRGTLGGNLVTNLFYYTRMPSYDNDLFHFGWVLPIAYREYQYLYRKTFTRFFHDLSLIKREGYNLKIGASKLRYKLKITENKVMTLANNSNIKFINQMLSSRKKPKYVNFKTWFQNELKDEILSFFSDKSYKSSEIVKTDEVLNLVRLHISGKQDYSNLLWQLINLEYFYQNFL